MHIFFNTFFKIFGFLSAIIVFLVIIALSSIFLKNSNDYNFSYYSGDKKIDQNIAIMKISGPIISNPTKINNFNIFNQIEVIYPSLIKKFLKELENNNTLALIISLDSPGGSVTASNEIFNQIVKFKQQNKIPVYFHSKNILTSGGYWIALSGDKIYSEYGAIIGSIGVKGPDWIYYNSPTALSSGFLGNSVESPNGIQLYSNTAGKSKDIFNPFRAPNDQEKLDLQKIVDDIYDDFINLVSSKRKIEKNYLKNQIGAMIFNTKQAKLNYLVDDQKNIDEIISIIFKDLKIDSAKIISNEISNKSNFLNLTYDIFFTNKNTFNNYKLKIKNQYCNNLFYEFSSVSTNTYDLNC